MPSNLNRYSDRSVTRTTRQAMDRTDARAADAAHRLDALHEVGREIRYNLVQARMESKAVEMMMPEMSSELHSIDQNERLRAEARLGRLDRDL